MVANLIFLLIKTPIEVPPAPVNEHGTYPALAKLPAAG